MSLLFWIILFCLLGGVLSVIAASVFLLLPESFRTRMLPHFVSFAIGALLGAAFLALLPHAISSGQEVDVHTIGLTVLIGVLIFFLLEKMVLWRHCHSTHCEAHTPHEVFDEGSKKTTKTLILFGDGLHNFVDGILIAAAFLTDEHLGIVTSIAVAAHEIPQEVGDFAILLHSGLTRARAFLLNILSSLATVVGGVLAYFGLNQVENVVPYVLALAASSFIYVAVADLIPGLHRRTNISATLQQIILISTGVIIIYLAHSTLH